MVRRNPSGKSLGYEPSRHPDGTITGRKKANIKGTAGVVRIKKPPEWRKGPWRLSIKHLLDFCNHDYLQRNFLVFWFVCSPKRMLLASGAFQSSSTSGQEGCLLVREKFTYEGTISLHCRSNLSATWWITKDTLLEVGLVVNKNGQEWKKQENAVEVQYFWFLAKNLKISDIKVYWEIFR